MAHSRWLAGAVAVACVLAPGLARAGVPSAVGVDGALQSSSGGPAADGLYKLTFKLYKDSFGGAAVYSEGPLTLSVSHGAFHHTLGATTPFDAKVLSGLTNAWLGVTVDGEPELPRKPLLSAPYALRAGVAEAVECSGCITDKHVDPAVFATLAKVSELSKVAQSGQFADLAGAPDLSLYAKKAQLPDVCLTGKYGDLASLPTLAAVGQSCGTGLVMKGIKADGSYECAQGGVTANALPKDGLDEISNGLLTNQFAETYSSAKVPLDIPDMSGAGVSDLIVLPDVGIAQGLSVSVDLVNSDIGKVRVYLFDPKGAQYTLYDQGGAGGSLKGTWPVPDKLVAGTLDGWVGQNPKGTWSLTVADLAGTTGGKDGKLNSWSMTVKTMSSKKVAATGGFQFFAAPSHPVACDALQLGYTYLNTTANALYICNGTEFFPLALAVPPGSTKDNPAASCKEILAKNPLAKDGAYWLSAGGATPFQAWCDMTTSGGGWTRCLAHRYMNTLPTGWKKSWVNHTWSTNGSFLFSDNATVASYGNFCALIAAGATQIYGRVRYPASFGTDFETAALTLPKTFFDPTSQATASGSGGQAIAKDNGTSGQGFYGIGCGSGYTSNQMQGVHALCLSNGAKYQAQHSGWPSGSFPASCADSSNQPCTCTQGDYCGGSNPAEKDIVITLYVR